MFITAFPPKRIRLLLVDGHPLVLKGTRSLLEGSDAFEVVGEALDAASGLAAAEQLRPDVVVLELALRGLSGLQMLARLSSAHPAARALAFTAHDEEGFVRSALDLGVAGYVLKGSAASVLRDGIQAVAHGRVFVDPNLIGFSAVMAAPRSMALSSREREVIALVALGHSSKDVASKMGVSVKTIETYRYRAAQKLGLRNRADLVRYALDRGWLARSSAVA
jgi:DNA-binding NarL/FixJ family response regulator